jgi:hypothetical protein
MNGDDPEPNSCSPDEPELDRCSADTPADSTPGPPPDATNVPVIPTPAPTPPSQEDYVKSDNEVAQACKEDPVAAPETSCGLQKTTLAVKVTDYQSQPIRSADVSIPELGSRTTNKYGIADYGEVPPRTYTVTVEKDGYRPDPIARVGPALVTEAVPAGTSTIIPVKLAVYRENIIFCGSEMEYKMFWLKMMFVASTWVGASTLRPADQTTVAYVEIGYTDLERLAFEFLHDKKGFRLVVLASGNDIVALINSRDYFDNDGYMAKFVLQDVLFFSHGQPDAIKLNYNSDPTISFSPSEIAASDADAFAPDGRFFSYACRTGISSWDEHFSSDEDAGREQSVAQQIADHFQVETHAFLTRNFYGEVLREPSNSKAIAESLKNTRAALVLESSGDSYPSGVGPVIQIPPDHEALPHKGLGISSGSLEEGTYEYTLWRKAGGIRLPRSDKTPSGLTQGLQLFNPK